MIQQKMILLEFKLEFNYGRLSDNLCGVKLIKEYNMIVRE